ncbi:MAG: phage tail protein [Pseudomonadota bacterium]
MNDHPPAAFGFCVHIVDNPTGEGGSFQAISGLDAERGVTEVAEGGENRFVHALPGRATSQMLTLERGVVSAGSPLFAWCKKTFERGMSEPVTPQSLTVELLDPEHTPVMAWSLSGAWPVTWTVGTLRSEINDIAIETLTLACSSISRHGVGVPQRD